MAFFQEELIKGTDGKDLGVPVVYHASFGERDFVAWEALHARSINIRLISINTERSRLRHCHTS